MSKQTQLSLTKGELQNIINSVDGMRVRDATFPLEEADVLYGFSVKAATTSENYIYCFIRTGTDTVTLNIYDNNFVLIDSNAVCKVTDRQAHVTHAINKNQIVVNSYGWSSPVWGYIGSTLVPATKSESIQPDTQSLDLFPGIVCSFADRFVWGYRNQLIINDPGQNPRVITSVNALSTSGVITDMFQGGDGGSLIIVTTDCVFTLPPDGIAGFQLSGIIDRLTIYSSLEPGNAASSRGTVFGLTPEGVMNIRTGELFVLTTYRKNRKITKPVGVGAAGDYRRGGTIWPTEAGYLISMPDGNCCEFNIRDNMISWLMQDNYSLIIRGIGTTLEGKQILFTHDAVLQWYGTDAQIEAGIALNPITPGLLSNNVRSITVTAEGYNTRFTKSYVRGALTVEPVYGVWDAAAVDVALWGAPETPLYEIEFRSSYHDIGGQIRTDGIYLEIGVTGSATKIENASFQVIQQGNQRRND